MTPAVEQLVRETMDLTGAEAPDLLKEDAPTLAGEMLALSHPVDTADDDAAEDDFYLVGIIGGKDVGKSSLVNAIVGQNVTSISSHGPGTEIAIAYVHQSREQKVRDLLNREVPNKFRVVVHQIAGLERQVLLDLPDIDSQYESHLVVTRQMLRHMLFPVWAQSVEKYADMAPQQILAQVAAGNDARNFLFCLTKADQLDAHGGEKAAAELREDFARRIARTTGLKQPPRVYVASARRPDQYDLPHLRALLARQKTKEAVRESKELASKRQDASLLEWLGKQDLVGQSKRLERLLTEAQETIAQRVAVPLVDRVLPQIAADPANRLALSDEILADRVSRWPLVTLVHTLLSPIMLMVRAFASKTPSAMLSADGLVDLHIKSQSFSAGPALQSAFGQLRQAHPPIGELYSNRRLWEEMEAEGASADLSRRLAITVERQRQVARERLSPRGGWLAPVRWLLTIGALLWFPIVQPMLEAILPQRETITFAETLGMLVAVLGVNYLLKSVTFLAIWFVVLWLALRWNTQRKVARMLSGWREADDLDPDLNLATQALAWTESLADPIRAAHRKMAALADRTLELRKQLTQVKAKTEAA